MRWHGLSLLAAGSGCGLQPRARLQAFAYEELYATLHALKSGRSAVVPLYDFVTSSRQEGGTVVGNASVVLVRLRAPTSPAETRQS